jgi:hypothetical protein
MQLCTHIQLKQPNFAVFFSSYCNTERSTGSLIQQASYAEGSLSVRESVKLAKSQNMLGLALDCRLLVSSRGSCDESFPTQHVFFIRRRPFLLWYKVSRTLACC